MVNLEQITQTGMFSIDSNRNLHPEMVSMAEQLAAEEIAYTVNSGRLLVSDLYSNFLSYEEDYELWQLSGRNLIFGFERLISLLFDMLSVQQNDSLVRLITAGHLDNFTKSGKERLGYNIFFDDLSFMTNLSNKGSVAESTRDYLATIIFEAYVAMRGQRGLSHIEVALRKDYVQLLGNIQNPLAERFLKQIAEAREEYYHGDPEGPHEYAPYHNAINILAQTRPNMAYILGLTGGPIKENTRKAPDPEDVLMFDIPSPSWGIQPRPDGKQISAWLENRNIQSIKEYIRANNGSIVLVDDYLIRKLHRFLRPGV